MRVRFEFGRVERGREEERWWRKERTGGTEEKFVVEVVGRLEGGSLLNERDAKGGRRVRGRASASRDETKRPSLAPIKK